MKGGERLEWQVGPVQEEFSMEVKVEEEVVCTSAESYTYILVEKGGDSPWTSTMPSSVITLMRVQEGR